MLVMLCSLYNRGYMKMIRSCNDNGIYISSCDQFLVSLVPFGSISHFPGGTVAVFVRSGFYATVGIFVKYIADGRNFHIQVILGHKFFHVLLPVFVLSGPQSVFIHSFGM